MLLLFLIRSGINTPAVIDSGNTVDNVAIIMIISMGQGEKAIKNVLGLKAPRGITSFGIMALVLQPFKMMFRRPGGAA